MGLSLTRKLINAHLVAGQPVAGEEIGLSVDQVLLTDTNGTGAFLQFEAMGFPRLRPPLVVTYIDHNVSRAPAPDSPGPAPPQPDHTAATSVTLARAARRASQRSPRSTATAARAAVCPAHAALAPPLSREQDHQDHRGSRIRAGRCLALGRGDPGVPGGGLDARCTGRVAGSGINVSYAP